MTESGRDGAAGMNGRDGRDSRPVPDPTALTAELVDKAVTGLREILETRMNGIDKEVGILQLDVRQRPHDIEVQITHLEKLFIEKMTGLQATEAEKFKAVDTRILERDDQVKQAKSDAKVGIDAALASAEKLVGQSSVSFKEAVDKAEKSTGTLLATQAESQRSTTKALEDKITDLKGRLDRIEGAAVGAITARTDVATTRTASNQNIGVIVGLVGMGVAVVALIERFVR